MLLHGRQALFAASLQFFSQMQHAMVVACNVQEADVGGVGADGFKMTISSRKLMHWLRDYGELMRCHVLYHPADLLALQMCCCPEFARLTID